ncbi:SGNH/GDSL hydrolase family protein [Streptomyces sp. NBC_01622]|uniref:SGNH/GDSL hydrolase family protein n=1 Tax=Streptomyces sp. NBC_01622 TaxID=2975903 RepID=UPI003863CE3C|nr:SGNH/GDSL hydrolase family protein [Streptomyces sp. NBC_01622]
MAVVVTSAAAFTLSAPTATPISTVSASTSTFAETSVVSTGGGSPYVALGDSYASGAGLGGVKDAECDRTSGSYPSLIARFFAVAGPRHAFKDVTCSGATTRDFWNARGSKSPQIDALTADTRLVTLTLGGNDVGFSSVLATCARLAPSDRDGSPCERYFTADGKDVLEERVTAMEGRVHDVLADIRRRSPHAKVIVVGYPALFPDDGVACPEVPFAKGDFAYLRDTTKKANRALARQAMAAGAGTSFADTYTPTIGHDMCQPRDERWIESLSPAVNTTAAHPNSLGQSVMAGSALRQIYKPFRMP